MYHRHRHQQPNKKALSESKPLKPRYSSTLLLASSSVFLSLNLYLSLSLSTKFVFFSFFLPILSLSLSHFDSQISQRYAYPIRDIVYFYFIFLCVIFFFFGFCLFPFCPKHFPSFYDIAIKTLALLFSLSTKPQSPLVVHYASCFPRIGIGILSKP